MSDLLECVIKAADAGLLSCAGVNAALDDELEKLCKQHGDRNVQQTLSRCLDTRSKRFNATVVGLVTKIDEMRRTSNFAVPDHYDEVVLAYLGKGKMKPVPDKGDGEQHVATGDFDSMLAQYHQKNPSLSLGRATEQFLRTPEGAAAYKEQKTERKAAALSTG